MALRRYSRTTVVRGGKNFGTAKGATSIYYGVQNGTISTDVFFLKSSQRLDILAGQLYGDSSLWWVIAAASGIGWGLQVPPGTLITAPLNLAEIGIYV